MAKKKKEVHPAIEAENTRERELERRFVLGEAYDGSKLSRRHDDEVGKTAPQEVNRGVIMGVGDFKKMYPVTEKEAFSGMAKFDPLQAKVTEVVKDFSAPMVITNPKTYKGVRSAFTQTTKLIRSIKDIEEGLKRPHLTSLQNIRAVAKTMLMKLDPIKDQLQENYRDWDVKQAEAKVEQERLEAERVDKIKMKIDEIRRIFAFDSSTTISKLQELITRADLDVIHEDMYMEFLPTAEITLNAAREALSVAYTTRQNYLFNRIVELTGQMYVGDVSELEGMVDKEEKRMNEKMEQEKRDMEAQPDIEKLDPPPTTGVTSSSPPPKEPVKKISPEDRAIMIGIANKVKAGTKFNPKDFSDKKAKAALGSFALEIHRTVDKFIDWLD